MGLKEIYQGAEDAYYAFLDNVQKAIPVYSIVDPLDKVVPSFMVFILLILAIVGGVGYYALTPKIVQLSIETVDAQGTAIAQVPLELKYANQTQSITTDAQGKASVEASVGQSIRIQSNPTGYQPFDHIFSVERDSDNLSVQLIESDQPKNKSLLFVTGNNKSTSGKPILAEFSCSSGRAVNPRTQTTNDGTLNVLVPTRCSTLNVTVKAAGFKSNASVTLSDSENTKTVSLEPLVIDKGNVEITIMDGNAVLTQPDFEITLFDSESGSSTIKQTTSLGKTKFENVPVGSYYATLHDDTGGYASAQSSTFQLQKNKTQSVSLQASKTVKGTIRVEVVEKGLGTPVENASVTIRLNGNAIAQQTTGANGIALFSLNDFGNYTIQVSGANNLFAGKEFPAPLNNANANPTIKAELDRCTKAQQNCGNVRVQVLDEDGLKVENAEVLLYFADSGYLAPYAAQFSDINGMARFSNVSAGKFLAKARKYPAEAQSNAQNVSTSKSTDFTVNMTIGNGTIKLKVVDSDGTIVPFPRVEFRTESGPECESGECVFDGTADGITQKSFKADKRVFAIVSKEGLESTITPFDQLLPNKTIERTVILNQPIELDRARIDFIGLFDNGKPANELKAGKSYTAQFMLRIPNNLTADRVGVFLRAGTQSLLENDVVAIKSLNAPLAIATRGTTYSPPLGTQEDDESLTAGQSSWAQLEFENPTSGAYLIEAEISVSAQAKPNQTIPLNYRSYSIQEETVLRDPIDSELGSAVDATRKQSRYAASYEKVFQEGKLLNACSENFCYTAERLFDQTNRLYALTPYHLTVFSPYTLSFSITNNSTRTLNDAELRVMNSSDGSALDNAVKIESYDIENADAKTISNHSLNGFEFNGIPLGNFSKNKEVQSKLDLSPEQVQSSGLRVQVISAGEIVFEQSISLPVVSSKAMELKLEPDFLGAMVSNRITATVNSEENPLSGVKIDVKKIAKDLTESAIETQFTKLDGTAQFLLPASSNGTKFSFNAQKSDYAPQSVTLNVDENIIETDPIQLGYALNPRTASEQSQDLIVQNKIGHDIEIVSIQWLGNIYDFLDVPTMNSQVAQLGGVPIAAQENISIPLSAILSQQAVIVGSRSISGSVKISVQEPESGARWDYLIPFSARVGFGPGVDNKNCLVASISEFSGSTQGTRLQKEFTLKNECLIDGKPAPLENVQAKLSLSGENTGRYQIMFRRSGNQTVTETLSEVNPILLISKLNAGEELDGIISFNAFPEMKGKKSQSTIQISAKTQTDSGVESINTIRPLSTIIHIIDLKQCVKVSQGLLLLGTGDSGGVNINTSDCASSSSNVLVNVRLCHDDGGGCDEIEVLPNKSFSLRGDADSKTVTVNRLTVAGLHGLKVEAQLNGTGDWVLLGIVRVKFSPKPGFDSIQLDKYEVDLPEEGSQASVTAVNSDYARKISVEAKKKNWRGWDDDKLSFHQAIATITGYAMFGSSVRTQDFTKALGVAGIGFAAAIGIALAHHVALGAALGPAGFVALGVFVTYLSYQYIQASEKETHNLYAYGIQLSKLAKKNQAESKSVRLNNRSGGNPIQGISTSWSADSLVSTKVNTKNLAESQELLPIVLQRQGMDSTQPVQFATITIQVKAPCYDDPQYVIHPTNWNIPAGCGMKPATFQYRVLLNTSKDNGALYFKETNPIPKTIASFATANAIPIANAQNNNALSALEKTQLNWNWNAIEFDSCDSINPNAVYCDATQFTIASIKRLNMLKEFFEANQNDFKCPSNGFSDYLNQKIKSPQTQSSAELVISNSSESFNSDDNSLTINATVTNKSNQEQPITLKAFLEPEEAELLDDGSNAVQSCEQEATIPSNGIQVVSCTLKHAQSETGTCNITFKLEAKTGVLATTDDFYTGTFSCQSASQTNSCWVPKSSDFLPYFLDQDLDYFGKYVKQKTVHWTNDIKDLGDLEKLLDYNVLLAKDSFSPSFYQDFVETYDRREFFEVPAYYSNPTDGLKKYLTNSTLIIGNPYTQKFTINASGEYRAKLSVNGVDDFSMFQDGKPSALATIALDRLPEAQSPTTPLQSIPFDNRLGLTSDGWNRDGYGTSFEGFNLAINNQSNPLTTNQDAGSQGVDQFNVIKRDDLIYLNKDLFNRGVILSVDLDRKEIVWSPSYATPVLLKVDAVQTSKPFEAAYLLNANNQPQRIGQSSGFWSAANSKCQDFSGKNSLLAFNVKPDQLSSNRTLGGNAYAVKWSNATKSGTEYLKTIYYTPRTIDVSIKSASNNATFSTANALNESTVSLNGVFGMHHNSPGNDAYNSLNSIEDVIELAKEGLVGVSDYGNRIEFWWNPTTLYDQSGNQASVADQSNALISGTDCLN